MRWIMQVVCVVFLLCSPVCSWASTSAYSDVGQALIETSEMASTPVVDTASTSVGATTLRFFDFITLPTTGKLYLITGIEWKNGATVAGNTLSGVCLVNANPPTLAPTLNVALGTLVANVGANTIQRQSMVCSTLLRGGTVVGVWVQADATAHTYRTASVTSSNNRKTVTFPAGGAEAMQETNAWTVSTVKGYVKLYYREYR